MDATIVTVVFISSVAYLLGGLIVFLKKNWSQSNISALTALSAGLILSIAILDLIPDTGKELGNSSFYVMLGFVVMYMIHQWSKSRITKNTRNEEAVDPEVRSTIAGISSGMLLHNFFEGLSIGISYTVNIHLGIAVTLALVLHKVPEGLTYTSAMLAIKANRKRTAGLLILQIIFTWMGAGAALFISSDKNTNEQYIGIALAITAGLFLYLGGTTLLPAVNKYSKRWLPLFFLGGILFYLLFHSLAEALG